MCLLGAGDARVMCILWHYQLLVTSATIGGGHLLPDDVTFPRHRKKRQDTSLSSAGSASIQET